MTEHETYKTYELSNGKYRALCLDRFPKQLAGRWLSDPLGIPSAYRSRQDPEASAVPLPLSEDGMDLFVKHHRRNVFKSFAECLARRSSPARRGFRVGLVLESTDVDAARPVACLERLVPGESFLILKHVDGLTLRDYLITTLPSMADPTQRGEFKGNLWKALGVAVARLHSANVRQRDLKAPNIMIREGAMIRKQGGSPQVIFVDLEGMQLLRSTPRRHLRVRDLARLAVSLRTPEMRAAGLEPGDWETVVREYLEACGTTRPEERDVVRWVKTTLAWATKREAHNRRRGRQSM